MRVSALHLRRAGVRLRRLADDLHRGPGRRGRVRDRLAGLPRGAAGAARGARAGRLSRLGAAGHPRRLGSPAGPAGLSGGLPGVRRDHGPAARRRARARPSAGCASSTPSTTCRAPRRSPWAASRRCRCRASSSSAPPTRSSSTPPTATPPTAPPSGCRGCACWSAATTSRRWRSRCSARAGAWTPTGPRWSAWRPLVAQADWVVPGHGAPQSREERAASPLAEDAAYLAQLAADPAAGRAPGPARATPSRAQSTPRNLAAASQRRMTPARPLRLLVRDAHRGGRSRRDRPAALRPEVERDRPARTPTPACGRSPTGALSPDLAVIVVDAALGPDTATRREAYADEPARGPAAAFAIVEPPAARADAGALPRGGARMHRTRAADRARPGHLLPGLGAATAGCGEPDAARVPGRARAPSPSRLGATGAPSCPKPIRSGPRSSGPAPSRCCAGAATAAHRTTASSPPRWPRSSTGSTWTRSSRCRPPSSSAGRSAIATSSSSGADRRRPLPAQDGRGCLRPRRPLTDEPPAWAGPLRRCAGPRTCAGSRSPSTAPARASAARARPRACCG